MRDLCDDEIEEAKEAEVENIDTIAAVRSESIQAYLSLIKNNEYSPDSAIRMIKKVIEKCKSEGASDYKQIDPDWIERQIRGAYGL